MTGKAETPRGYGANHEHMNGDPMSTNIVPRAGVLSPDWTPAIINGEPDSLLNCDAVALMIFDSPLGIDGALAKLKTALPVDYFEKVAERVEAAR